MKFYTYELIDPQTNLPFYIGKGKKDRMKLHERVVKSGKQLENKKLHNKIKKILSLGLRVQYKQYFKTTEREALDYEITLIKQYRAEKINLCNLTDRGEGISGAKFKMPQSQKDKISAIMKGVPKSEVHKEKLRKPKSKEHKEKLSQIKLKTPTKHWLGKKFSESHKSNMSKVKIGVRPKSVDVWQAAGKKRNSEIKNKTLVEIYGEERAAEIKAKSSLSKKGKKTGSESNHAKQYVIIKNSIKTTKLTTINMLSSEFGISSFIIKKMIKSGEFRNGISITL